MKKTILAAASVLLCSPAFAQPPDHQLTHQAASDCRADGASSHESNMGNAANDRRFEQALRLTEQARRYIERAHQFHRDSQIYIAQAKKLKGQAQMLQNQIRVPHPVRLSGSELKAATAQYQADLANFKAHSNQYNALIGKFNREIGRCQADESAYQAYLKEYQLHCGEFHMPNIEPPHVCGRLQMTAGEASSAQNQYHADQMKVAQAAQEMQDQENKLRMAQGNDNIEEAKLVTAAVRSQRERELVDAFGRLREEYSMLKIEKKQIDGSTTATKPITNSKVMGKVK